MTTFDPRAHTFDATLEGFEALRFSAKAEVNGKDVGALKWKPVRGTGRGQVFRAKTRGAEWEIRLKKGRGVVEVAMSGRLSRKADRAVLTPVCFQDFPADHVLVHGRKMGGCDSHLLKKRSAHTLKGAFLLAVTRKGHTLQVAHPLRQRDISSLSGETLGGTVRALSASTVLDPCGRTRLWADPVFLSASPDGHRLMTDWAAVQIRDREPVEVPQESGWNSWDYYRWTITEDEVLKNAEYIAADPVLSRHVKRLIVDDGWQYCYGEWEANSLFPSGMEKLAKTLRRMGFTPGLWFAPTIAEPHARVAQLHPEMLASGPAGVPCLAYSCMERKGFLLDPTHPRVIAWWTEMFRRYAGYGYRYFKLDFLAWTLPGRRFHKPGTAPGELMRHIVTPIRAAVGPKSRLLGCNFTFDAGPGLADDVRVASDIHASWRYVKHNAVAVGARFWAHRRLWINDPDFAVCRGAETTDDPNRNQLKMLLPYVHPGVTNRELVPGLDAMDSLADLTAREAQTWLSLVIISGGAVNLSDNLPRLNPTGLRLVRKAVCAEKGDAGIPLDLFRSELPAYWVQKTTPSLHRILLVNWQDRPAVFRMDLKTLNLSGRNLKNFWTDAPVTTRSGRLEVELPPHACLLAESRET
ncbi:MAG: alpha-galactosidase [Chthoniobacterales bacterium]|nr:alpha-galactosidase [Chthoniobacterales bacterium]